MNIALKLDSRRIIDDGLLTEIGAAAIFTWVRCDQFLQKKLAILSGGEEGSKKDD